MEPWLVMLLFLQTGFIFEPYIYYTQPRPATLEQVMDATVALEDMAGPRINQTGVVIGMTAAMVLQKNKDVTPSQLGTHGAAGAILWYVIQC
uniref:Uncharacterized protein n=1 Tax=Sphaerodactylus townsendi TaxID=933632 RepID=A0ACB8FH97_9SAUR